MHDSLKNSFAVSKNKVNVRVILMRKFSTTVILSALFFVAGVSEASVNWIANSVWPPNNHHTQGLEYFAKRVGEMSKGELNITVSAGGALGFKGPELLKAVRDGMVPVSDMLTAGIGGDEPLFQVGTLPFLIHSFEQGRIFNDIAKPYYEKTLESKWGQKLLYIAPWTSSGIWTKKELKNLSDMKGLKCRTYDRIGSLFIEAVGGTPVAMPFGEVYTSLATGLIDSVITSAPSAVDGKFWEVLSYFEPINIIVTSTNFVTVNLKMFSSLSPELQKIVLDCAAETEKDIWARVAQIDSDALAICYKNGVKEVPVSDSFMQEMTMASKVLYEEWYKGAPEDAKKIYTEFLNAVDRKSIIEVN